METLYLKKTKNKNNKRPCLKNIKMIVILLLSSVVHKVEGTEGEGEENPNS